MTDTERVKADWVVLWRRCIGQRVFGLALSAFFLQVVYRKVQGKTIRYNMKRQVTLDATELMILQGSLFDIFQRGNTLYCIVGAFDCVTSHYTSVYCTTKLLHCTAFGLPFNTTLYKTCMLHLTVQHYSKVYYIILPHIVVYRTTQRCTVLNNTVQHYTVQHYTTLYQTV